MKEEKVRFLTLFVLIWLTSAIGLAAREIKWPNPEILIPPLVKSYIVSECHAYEGFSEETVSDCIRAETYGYRAVVMMLTEPKRGAEFAARYRTCRAGLGNLGGRFHRRRAECMSAVVKYIWRFEFMQEASVGHPAIGNESTDHAEMPDAKPRFGSRQDASPAVSYTSPRVMAQN